MFAAEIERELRMLEEYVLDEDVSDDLGESMMARDDDFEPPEVPFQPKPTSVSILAIPEEASDFSRDSNHTTAPKSDPADIHGANTKILDNGRGRNAARPPPPPPPAHSRAQTQPPPVPAPRPRPTPATRSEFDEDLHSAPTMIIDVSRARGRGRN
jgi:hypothetical protein